MGNQPSANGTPAAASSSSSSSNVSYTSTQANGTGTQTQARKPAPTQVILNVYEPSKPQASMPGFGIFHTGIELSGTEYSFAGGEDAGSGTGVMTQQPRATPAGGDWKFKEAIVLGTVHIEYKEFDKILQEMKDAFPANQYDLIHCNCNHFTTAVAKRLGLHGNYPSWVNRAASWGSMFVAKKAGAKGAPELPPPKESVFKTTTGHRLDGTTVAPGKSSSSSSKSESKKPEEKKAQAASAGGKSTRKNPWADPNFVPKTMKDPVVAGFAKPAAAASAQ